MTHAEVCHFFGAATARAAPRPPPARRFRRAPLYSPLLARLHKRGMAIARRVSYCHLLLIPILLLLVAELPRRILRTALPEHPGLAARGSVRTSPFVDPRDVRPGVAVVACCMNRQSTLRRVLRSWRSVTGVDEIVVVDWGSSPPLRDIVLAQKDPRIRLIRVQGEPEWVLSRAYNLAMRASSRANVIRTDCDYMLKKDFVAAHQLPKSEPRAFFAGNYLLARDANEVHLNGAVYIRRADFFAVGGYDERIQTYGWDDEDLYTRLGKAGIVKKNISYAHLSHVPHGDGARAQRDVRFVQVEIDLNRLLLHGLNDSWSPRHMQDSQWAVSSSSGGQITMNAIKRPRSLKDLSSPAKFEAAWKLALEQRLAADYAVPWDILTHISSKDKKLLLTRLNRAAAGRAADNPPRIFFVHCMHGLGNRLRALGSAMSFAKNTGRELVVIWETDRHISSNFADLFVNDMVVLPRMKLHWPFTNSWKWDKSWLQFEFINYMEMDGEGAVKDKFVVDKPSKHIYFKSAYVMNADKKLTSWESDNANLRSLKPIPYVAEKVASLEKQGLSSMVGVHIRDRTLGRDIKDVNFKSEYGDKASRTMEYWRKKSSHLTFIPEMRRLLKEDPELRFYVATDTFLVLSRLRKEFPGRILTTERDCDGRDSVCIRYALIDILALAKTKKILGSNWSSFTEAAQRFGEKHALLAGKDFAVDKDAPL